MKNYQSIEYSPGQEKQIKIVDTYDYESKNGQDTFNSPTDSERHKIDFCIRSKSAITYGSQKSKYSTNSKLTKSKLFSVMSKGKNDTKTKQNEKNEEIELLKDSLLNLTNAKMSIAHKLKKQLTINAEELDIFLSILG